MRRICEHFCRVELGSTLFPSFPSVRINVLIRVRIRAEDFDEITLLFEIGDGFGDFAVIHEAIAIDEEKLFPGFAFAWARLDFRHVQFVTTKCAERGMQRADFMLNADHQTGAIFARCRTALPPVSLQNRTIPQVPSDLHTRSTGQ